MSEKIKKNEKAKKQTWRAGNMLYPVPAVMVSCARKGEKPNIITVAWAGTVCSDPAMVSISVRKERHSHDIIKETGEFVINLTAVPSVKIEAPAIAESPVNIECKVKQVLELGSHDMFIAEVMAVNVAESLLDEKGTLHLSDADLIAYSHGRYYGLGDFIGKFGYSVQKPSKTKSSRKKK